MLPNVFSKEDRKAEMRQQGRTEFSLLFVRNGSRESRSLNKTCTLQTLFAVEK